MFVALRRSRWGPVRGAAWRVCPRRDGRCGGRRPVMVMPARDARPRRGGARRAPGPRRASRRDPPTDGGRGARAEASGRDARRREDPAFIRLSSPAAARVSGSATKTACEYGIIRKVINRYRLALGPQPLPTHRLPPPPNFAHGGVWCVHGGRCAGRARGGGPRARALATRPRYRYQTVNTVAASEHIPPAGYVRPPRASSRRGGGRRAPCAGACRRARR